MQAKRIALFCLAILAFVAAGPVEHVKAAGPELKYVAAVLYRQPDGTLVPISQNYGPCCIKPLKTDAQELFGVRARYANAHAKVKVAEQRPVFYVPDYEEQRFRFIRLKVCERQNRRQLSVFKGMFHPGVGVPDGSVAAEVRKHPDGTVAVTPAQDLPDGEYFLIRDSGWVEFFDFGVRASKAH